MATPPWIKTITNYVEDNATTILSAAAVAGLVGTVVLAVRATPAALEDIAMAQEDKQMNTPVEVQYKVTLTPAEVFRVTWRAYLPAALTGTATIACIVGANTVGLRRQAALAASLTLVDKTFIEYRDKVIEHFGEKDEEKVRDKIAEDKIKNSPTKDVIFVGTGEVLCYDELTGRWFKSDGDAIRRAALDLDAQVLDDHHACLNDFYRFVGLDAVLAGEELGWNVDKRPRVRITGHVNDCDQPALSIGWERPPFANYEKF